MARGAPLLWGVFLGVTAGVGGLFALVTNGPAPSALGYPLLGLGVVAVVVGAYVRRVAPEGVETAEPTEDRFEPSQLGALLLGGTSVPFLGATLHLLYLTRVPYVYPTITLLAFTALFVKGSVRYWQNTLTTYYVTDERVISEYRFLALKRSSIAHEDVTNVARHQSLVETLTGLGSVRITVAGSSLVLRDLARPADAEKLLNSLSR